MAHKSTLMELKWNYAFKYIWFGKEATCSVQQKRKKRIKWNFDGAVTHTHAQRIFRAIAQVSPHAMAILCIRHILLCTMFQVLFSLLGWPFLVFVFERMNADCKYDWCTFHQYTNTYTITIWFKWSIFMQARRENGRSLPFANISTKHTTSHSPCHKPQHNVVW